MQTKLEFQAWFANDCFRTLQGTGQFAKRSGVDASPSTCIAAMNYRSELWLPPPHR